MTNAQLADATAETLAYIARHWKAVQLKGLCPICQTGRDQYGQCAWGHIVFENFETVSKPAPVLHGQNGAGKGA